MSNPHYTPTAAPVSFSRGRSQVIRDEFGLIAAGFTSVEAAIQLLAPKASPTFTGTVTATGSVNFAGTSQVTVPTVANVSDSSTNAASTAFVQAVLGASGSLLPPQATHAGKFLQTNGTSASWQKALPDRVADRYLFTSGGVDVWRTPLPVGSIIVAQENATLPANWLACDGSSVSIASYPLLEPLLARDYPVENYTLAPRNPKLVGSAYIAVSGNSVCASYYVSTDRGTTWAAAPVSASSFFVAADGFHYYISGTTLFRSASIDGTYSSHGTVPSNTYQIESVGGNHLIIRGNTIAFSTNGGVTFTNCTPSAGTFHSLGEAPMLLVGSAAYHTSYTTDFLLQKSTNGGQTWTSPSTIVSGTTFSGSQVSLFHVDGKFLVRTNSGFYISSSESGPWTAATLPFSPNTNGMTACLGNFWGCSSSTLYKSTTGATGTWSTVSITGVTFSANTILYSVGNRLWVGPLRRTYGDSTIDVFAYSDDGTTFTILVRAENLSDNPSFSFAVNSANVVGFRYGSICLFSTSPDNLFVAPTSTTYRFMSPPVALGSTFIAIGINSSSQTFFVKSTDNGDTWSAIGASVSVYTPIAASSTRAIARVATNDVVVTDGNTHWTVAVPLPPSILFFAAGRFILHSNGTSMAISVDGDTWITRTAPTTLSNSVFFGSGSRLWLARNGLWFSDDYGVTWTLVSNSGEFATHRAGAEVSGEVFYHANSALYLSNQNGLSFQPLSSSMMHPSSSYAVGSVAQGKLYFLSQYAQRAFRVTLTASNVKLPDYRPSFSGNTFARYRAYINGLAG